MCGGNNKHYVAVEATHTTHSRQTQGTQRARVVLRACSHGCARTTQHTPFHKKEKRKKREEESSVRRWRRSSR
nr:MAG TPA: hypothetical protein [Caudoviricetes sp.]